MEVSEEQFKRLEFQMSETNAKMDKLIILMKKIADDMGK